MKIAEGSSSVPRPLLPQSDEPGFRHDLARAIRARRLRLGLSISEAARRSNGGISCSMWSYVEHGTEPAVSVFCAIAKVLELSSRPWSAMLKSLGVNA